MKIKKDKNIGKIADTIAKHMKQIAHSGGYITKVMFDGNRQPDCKISLLLRKRQSFK